MRVPYHTMLNEFTRVLSKKGFSEDEAQDAAKIFADNSLFGVYSHGLNRFPIVVDYLEKGVIDPGKKPVYVVGMGCMERWDGQRGFGPLNAKKAMARACELAKNYGIGLVALGNNNHWMRGGTYGWQAAEEGLIGICWSNTMPNMPAWGAKDRRIGNNPFVMSIPRANGEHVLLDMAMSQYSYGKVEQCRLQGKELPLPGGYNAAGKLTKIPEEIEKTGRFLPAGYWKGSGMSIVLDLAATILSDGNSVKEIGTFGEEVGLTQIMIAIDPEKMSTKELINEQVDEIIEYIKGSEPADTQKSFYYPGERAVASMKDNLKKGIPVIEEKWNQVLKM